MNAKDIPGYPYTITDCGMVFSIKSKKYLTPETVGPGYQRVDLRCNKQRRREFVHILVLEAFVGPRPKDMNACHNDGNPSNNHLENLRWDTQQNNILDKRSHGTQPLGEKHHGSLLTDEQYSKILESDLSAKELAEEFNIKPINIYAYRRRHKGDTK